MQANLRGENVVDVDLPLRFGQAEQSRDEGAFPSAGSAHDADLADGREEEKTQPTPQFPCRHEQRRPAGAGRAGLTFSLGLMVALMSLRTSGPPLL